MSRCALVSYTTLPLLVGSVKMCIGITLSSLRGRECQLVQWCQTPSMVERASLCNSIKVPWLVERVSLCNSIKVAWLVERVNLCNSIKSLRLQSVTSICAIA